MTIETVPGTENPIKTALERAARAMTLRESLGKETARTRVELDAGLSCRIAEGSWQLTTDMPKAMGGENLGPTPGVMGRAAIGSCFATSFAMWAARCDVAFDRIEVDVEADYDSRGELGVDDAIPPGYLRIRLVANIVSDAPEQEIRRVLEISEQHTSWLDMMRRPITTSTRCQITRSR